MKRWIALLVAAVMALSLVACNNSNNTQNNNSGAAPGSASAPDTAPLNFPTRDIKILNPNSAGGGVDVVCRIIANTAQEKKMFNGQTMIVECMPGAGSALGQSYVAKQAEPDGYTILAITASIVNNPILNADTVDFETSDFKWIGIFAEVPSVLIVPADSAINSWNDLDAAAKERSLIFSTAGNGTNTHTSPMIWANELDWKDIQFLHQAGAAEQTTQVMGGHCDVAMMTIAEALSAVQSGGAKCIGICADAGSTYDIMPGVPTLADQGYDYQAVNIRGLAVSKNLPDDVYQYLVDEFMKLYNDSDFQAAINDTGNFACAKGPEETQKWAESLASQTRAAQELMK